MVKNCLFSILKKENTGIKKINMMARIALFIYSLIGVLNILSAIIEQPLLRTITKPLLMPMLMLYVFSKTHILYRNKIVFILIFAWLGDLFLLIPGNSPLYFQLGLGSFLIMQIGYIRLFTSQNPRGGFVLIQWIAWPIVPVIVYVAFLLTFLMPHIPNALFVPVSLYALALGTMFYSAFLRTTDSSYFFVLLGALFFVFSDSFLAIAKFYYSFPGNSIMIMGTYIPAQLLLIFGLCKLQSNPIIN
jgi:uncharacterized membrane protein YhhN